MPERWDVVIVGSGNAGLSAALTAAASGASVLVIDAGPEEWIGGNSAFTAGAFRTTYGSLDDLRPVLPVDDATAASIDVAPYTADDFRNDIQSMAGGRSDPDLVDVLVGEAADAVRWLADRGVSWELLEARQSFLVDGRRRFWGNLTIGIAGGGIGLIEAEAAAARWAGVMLRFDTRLVELELSEGRVVGVVVAGADGHERIEAGAVVLASGGFEADASRRAAYLGPGWDLAKVRGTPYDTGDPMFLAIAAGAATAGHWSGCHAIAWDAAAPPFGDRVLTNRFSRQSYPFGIVVDRDGRRFVDEGADFRNYTYARYGAEILRRPGALAFHLFDATTAPFIAHVDYSTAIDGRSRFEAASLEELADGAGIDRAGLRRTINDVQRRGRGYLVRSVDQGRQGDRGRHPAEVELGATPRHTTVRGLCGHVRDHVHVRRPADRPRRSRARCHRPGDPRALRGGRDRRRAVPQQLPGRQRAHIRDGLRAARRDLRG